MFFNIISLVFAWNMATLCKHKYTIRYSLRLNVLCYSAVGYNKIGTDFAVSDSVKMAFSDERNIFEWIYEIKYIWILYHKFNKK